ncbi:RDD family protein [Hydrogenimonas sp.]
MSRWRKVKQGKVETQAKLSDTPKESRELHCAPVTLRLKAFLTDTFMITMPILYIVIYLVMGSREGFREHMGQGWLEILAVHMAVTLAFWGLKAQTPGMKAYDLRLVDAKTGQKPPFWKLVVRYIAMQIGIVSFLGMFVPFFLKSRDALWDLASATCLVEEPREG